MQRRYYAERIRGRRATVTPRMRAPSWLTGGRGTTPRSVPSQRSTLRAPSWLSRISGSLFRGATSAPISFTGGGPVVTGLPRSIKKAAKQEAKPYKRRLPDWLSGAITSLGGPRERRGAGEQQAAAQAEYARLLQAQKARSDQQRLYSETMAEASQQALYAQTMMEDYYKSMASEPGYVGGGGGGGGYYGGGGGGGVNINYPEPEKPAKRWWMNLARWNI